MTLPTPRQDTAAAAAAVVSTLHWCLTWMGDAVPGRDVYSSFHWPSICSKVVGSDTSSGSGSGGGGGSWNGQGGGENRCVNAEGDIV